MNDESKKDVAELTESELSKVTGGLNLSVYFMANGVEVDCTKAVRDFSQHYYEGQHNSCSCYSTSQQTDKHCCETCQSFSPHYGYKWVYINNGQGAGGGDGGGTSIPITGGQTTTSTTLGSPIAID